MSKPSAASLAEQTTLFPCVRAADLRRFGHLGAQPAGAGPHRDARRVATGGRGWSHGRWRGASAHAASTASTRRTLAAAHRATCIAVNTPASGPARCCARQSWRRGSAVVPRSAQRPRSARARHRSTKGQRVCRLLARQGAGARDCVCLPRLAAGRACQKGKPGRARSPGPSRWLWL